jgi:hypothetical protein
MPTPNQVYQPLAPRRWFRPGRIRAWRAADHLLLVEDRFFTEHYTRLFWAEIQTVLLYQLHSPSSFLRASEIICLCAVLAPLLLWKSGWPDFAAVAFLPCYALWRFRRPHWACEFATRLNVKRFAIPGALSSCRRLLDEIKISITQIQGALPDAPDPAAPATPPPVYRSIALPRQPVLAVHVIAFVLGLLSPFSRIAFVLYCIALIVAWFFQRDLAFPFAVRSASVMSQIFAALQIVVWTLSNSGISGLRPVPFNHWQFGLPRVLFSLYGIAAVFQRSLELVKPSQQRSAVLGLSELR